MIDVELKLKNPIPCK